MKNETSSSKKLYYLAFCKSYKSERYHVHIFEENKKILKAILKTREKKKREETREKVRLHIT